MKRVLGIFAHPDDEALGPAGTLATLALTQEVYLLFVTSGEAAGKTPSEKAEIRDIRRQEVRNSAQILGVKDVFFLDYEDGTLCNSIYQQLAGDISQKVEELKPETLITFEVRGVSGHIDHITVSLVTTFVFEKSPFLKKILYYVTTKKESERMRDYFIYFPEGYERSEVDEIVSTDAVWNKKIQAMQAHHSQHKDVETELKIIANQPKEEYFMVKSKRS